MENKLSVKMKNLKDEILSRVQLFQYDEAGSESETLQFQCHDKLHPGSLCYVQFDDSGEAFIDAMVDFDLLEEDDIRSFYHLHLAFWEIFYACTLSSPDSVLSYSYEEAILFMEGYEKALKLFQEEILKWSDLSFEDFLREFVKDPDSYEGMLMSLAEHYENTVYLK